MKRAISSSFLVWRAPKPAWATTAPDKPPRRVWLVLEGMPNHQVRRSQVMAAIRAAAMTAGTTNWLSAIPLAIVVATEVPASAPAKLRVADMTRAYLAGRTPVLTTVAMELAVSWNPLM